MKTRLLLAVLVWMVAVALTAWAQSSPAAAITSLQASESKPLARLEKETFVLINQYRQANDLPVLIWSDAVADQARIHSVEMASRQVDFGHDGFRERVKHLSSVMPAIQGAGENVLMTGNPVDVAHVAVKLWLASPRHLKNIRGDYNYSGLGVSENTAGTIYFTQLFLKANSATAASETQASPGTVSPFTYLAPPETRPIR